MRRKPLKIAIDVDGVLGNFSQAFRAHINALYNLELKDEPLTWYWSNLVTQEQFNAAWKAWSRVYNAWATLQPLSDAYTLAYAIQEGWLDDAELWFLTSRERTEGDSVLVQTKEWLFWNLGVDAANVIVVRHSTNKADVIRALDMTHSIDDFPPTVTALNHQYEHKAYLMLRPWNEYEQKAYDLPFVRNIEEFLEKVRA